MSFLYPRQISFSLPEGIENDTPGIQDYAGEERKGEVQVPRTYPASIQFRGQARSTGAELPADTAARVLWDILLPKRGGPPFGSIPSRATVLDDLGNRYQVVASYPHPMGYTLRCELIEP